MNSFKGKVVLITGAGKGTGRAVAEMFAARGASVAVNDISPVNLDETVARITAAGGQVKAYIADIAKKMPIQGLLNQVLDDFGQIDILVNCAEVEPQKTVLEMDEWDWVRTLDVNLTGAFLLTQSAGRIMKEKGGGVIVHIGGREKGQEKRAAYFSSKAGLETLVKSAAQEFAAFGVKVCLYSGESSRLLEEILTFCSPVEAEMEDPEYLFSGLRNAPREVQRILGEIPDFYEEAPRADGSWNSHQILAHLRDVNKEVYIPRLEQIAEQTNPLFQDFDGERWMKEHYDPAEPMDRLLAEFKHQCEETADWLERLPAEDWERPGTHVTLGEHSFLWWADRLVAHIGEHLAQLRGE
ncbi:MAG: SDR family NAD(P)-dependent oxidoreductase [Chloroflexi bacterium]|nr:SDR family NAD(P)-dependent oxidoreductase [Chloroflexota bacterium]